MPASNLVGEAVVDSPGSPLATAVAQQPRRHSQVLWVLLICGSILGWLGVNQLPFPGVDDLEFKAPAVTLIRTGRFGAEALRGFFPGIEDRFLMIPPLYPLAYSLWAKVFGLSLTAALAFHAILRLATVAVTARIVSRFSPRLNWLVLALLVVFGASPDFLDRPDALASLFGVIALDVTLRHPDWSLRIGALSALACLSQPIVGGVYCIVVLCAQFEGISRTSPNIRLAALAAIRTGVYSVLFFALGWAPLIIGHFDEWKAQFVGLLLWNMDRSEQSLRFHLTYLIRNLAGWPALILAIYVATIVSTAWRRPVVLVDQAPQSSLALGLALSILLLVAFAPDKATYWYAIWPLATIAFATATVPSNRNRLGRVVRLAAVLFVAARAARAIVFLTVLPLTWTEADTYTWNAARLRAALPPDATVYINGGLWNCLAADYELRDLFFAPRAGLKSGDYMTSLANGTGQPGVAQVDGIRKWSDVVPEHVLRRETTLTALPNTLLGYPLSRSRWSYQFVLLQTSSQLPSAPRNHRP